MKTQRGNFFEDFQTGQLLKHPTPRTVTDGDAALYIALTGDRRPMHCAATFAAAHGFRRETVHDLLTFHIVFGKSVGQISLNAVANLGYADVRFIRPVFAGDTLRAESKVLGKKEVSSGKAGVVWVSTRGLNQRDEEVLRYIRWVMVEKRDPATPTGAADVVETPGAVAASELAVPLGFGGMDPPPPGGGWVIPHASDTALATGGQYFWDDYTIGERIDHVDGMTIDETDHTSATRLYQNSAKVHFNAHQMASSRFGKRLMYGGHVISVAWALAFNGLENVLGILAWNGGSHVAPTFAGDTLYAVSEIVDKQPLAGRDDVGALRIKLTATKNGPTDKVLELDLWVMTRRA
jgi:2-methylfumaryl-CoA hydratase